jgi:cytochrome c5
MFRTAKPDLLRRSALLLLLLALAACGKEKLDEEKTAELIQPVARLALSDVVANIGARSGEEVVKTLCASCHATGTLNSPKTGDKAAWAPRIAQGTELLYKHAFEGKGLMPARGGANLSDDELRAAVDHLVSLAR